MKTKFGNAILDTNGYYMISTGKEGNHGKRLHRLIYEDFWGVKLPPEVHIHHKDGNKLNNCILNLEALDGSEHNRHHMLGENNPMYGLHEDTHPRYGIPLSDETKQKLSDSLTGRKYPLKDKITNSKSRNTIGYFRVTTQPCNTCKKGFIYVYRYYDESNKRKSIVSTKLDKLEEKVLAKGLEWIKFDEVNNEGLYR